MIFFVKYILSYQYKPDLLSLIIWKSLFKRYTIWLFIRFENCRDLYGIEHPRSGRTISTLREPMYRRIAQERGEVVPELPTNGPNPNPPEPAESPVYI